MVVGECLTFGELPGIANAPADQRADLLRSYCSVYLEEELRREALVKDWVVFARFLQLAAAESGQMLNYAKIAKDAGVALPTVKSYYQLLEDMFMGFRVSGFSGSPRKHLLSTERICLWKTFSQSHRGFTSNLCTSFPNPFRRLRCRGGGID